MSALQELRKYIELFRKSGKFSMALMKNAGEKEYYLATAFEEIYVPPSASIRLNGFSVGGECTLFGGVCLAAGVAVAVMHNVCIEERYNQMIASANMDAHPVRHGLCNCCNPLSNV